MQKEDASRPIPAATSLENGARAVASALADIARPSEITEVIRILSRVEEVMSQVYAELATWHGVVKQGVHHAGEEYPADPQNPGWVRAEVALTEASQYSKDAAAALERARIANTSALWFDEIRADDL